MSNLNFTGRRDNCRNECKYVRAVRTKMSTDHVTLNFGYLPSLSGD